MVEPPVDPVATEGADIITLTSGDDTVTGLGGKDWVIGGCGNDSIDGEAGDDALIAPPVLEPVEAEDAPDALPPQGGLYGGAGEDSINGRMGSDWIDGGDGNDDVRGGVGSDSTYTTEDGELREAGIFAGAGDDMLRGAESADQLWATGGGTDLLIGGDGADAFGASGDAGDATVKDFVQGQDVIASDAGVGFADIGISQDGKDALVQVGDTVLRLVKVDSTTLTEDDFLFIELEMEEPPPMAEDEPKVDPMDIFMNPEESADAIDEAEMLAGADDPNLSHDDLILL